MLERSIWLKLFSIAFTFMRCILFYFYRGIERIRDIQSTEISKYVAYFAFFTGSRIAELESYSVSVLKSFSSDIPFTEKQLESLSHDVGT